jgi:DNA-binding response OmpR family regulator
MPEMDGFEFLERVKANEQWQGLPFIMLTARAEMETRLNALRIGVDDYLLKPFDEE